MTWTTFCYTNRFAECNVKQRFKMLRFKMLKIIFGTESGNAEMAAEDMAAVLTEAGIEAKAVAMDDYDVNGLTDEEHVILMTSTYGEGELPMTTLPFYESLKTLSPNLSGIKFSAFGLGDSTYETYNQAIKTLIGKVRISRSFLPKLTR
ncbi:flavodoxin family protein [Klebsiella aerogenes]